MKYKENRGEIWANNLSVNIFAWALITMASILKHHINMCDMVCRYGGDEFIILIESDDKTTAIMVKERIQKASKEYNLKKIKPYQLSMSFGHASMDPSKKKSLQEILREADHMMYFEKDKCRQESGRGRGNGSDT